MLLDKINELEIIMLGKEASNPDFAWLKVKFDYLRVLATAQQSVQQIAFGKGLSARLGNLFIRFGLWIASIGNR